MITVSQASGERIFVVGDLHGCAKETDVLISFLISSQGLTSKDLVVFLGDYIDRGPDSKSVISSLVALKQEFLNIRFLKGNHEDMLMDFLGFGGNLGESFLYNGGLETIQSYGISVFSPPDEMMQLLPEEHFQFFSNLESIISVPGYLMVHAGINFDFDLSAQKGTDIYWIREPFISAEHNLEATVIFGHTPHREVFDHRPYKLGLDTGLVFGNKLSCLELVSGELYQIKKDSRVVDVYAVSP